MGWGRKIMQISATQQGVVYALCVDGSVWMLPDTLPVALMKVTEADWRRLPDLPGNGLSDPWGVGDVAGSPGPIGPVGPSRATPVVAQEGESVGPLALAKDGMTWAERFHRSWWGKQ